MIGLLPELIIIIAIFSLFILRNRFDNLASKKVFNISKLFLILSFVASIVFHNQNVFEQYLSNNPKLIFIKSIVYIYSIIWFGLSSRWFANKNKNGIYFAILGLIQVLSILLLISANQLILIGILLSVLSISNYFLLSLKRQDDEDQCDRKAYIISAILLLICFWTGLFFIKDLPILALVLTLPIIFYLLGIAPFHAGFVDVVGQAILPASGFVSTIGVFGYFALLNFMSNNVFANQAEIITTTLQIFGVLSLFIGAVYATIQTNIRRIFAYSSVFHVGFMIIALSNLDNLGAVSAFIYLFVYIISLFGIFASFFALKQNGEYQKELPFLNGVAHSCPFVISAFMVFLISLMGCPPIVGFLGRISVINYLVASSHFGLIALIIISLMIMIYAYLNIIKVFYFTTPTNKKFDRIDFGVYLVLFINLVLVFIAIIKPAYLMNYVENLIDKL